MAKRQIVTLVDDISGAEAQETIPFSFEGTHYEIDLTSKNAEKFRKAIGTYLTAARRVNGTRRRRATPKVIAAPGTIAKTNGVRNDPTQLKAIREWAGRNGHTVSAKGRIPGKVIAAFEADMAKTAART